MVEVEQVNPSEEGSLWFQLVLLTPDFDTLSLLHNGVERAYTFVPWPTLGNAVE